MTPAEMSTPNLAPTLTHTDFGRLEEKLSRRMDRSDEVVTSRLDKMGEALTQLISMQAVLQHQERQIEIQESRVLALEEGQRALAAMQLTAQHQEKLVASQGARLDRQEEELRRVNSKVDGWINKALGAAFLVAVLWAIFSKVYPGAR